MGGGRGGLIALVGLVVVVVLLRSVARWPGAWRRWPSAWSLGGALGNLADRVFRAGDDGFLGGRVVDFIDLQWWPVFNVADIAVVLRRRPPRSSRSLPTTAMTREDRSPPPSPASASIASSPC